MSEIFPNNRPSEIENQEEVFDIEYINKIFHQFRLDGVQKVIDNIEKSIIPKDKVVDLIIDCFGEESIDIVIKNSQKLGVILDAEFAKKIIKLFSADPSGDLNGGDGVAVLARNIKSFHDLNESVADFLIQNGGYFGFRCVMENSEKFGIVLDYSYVINKLEQKFKEVKDDGYRILDDSILLHLMENPEKFGIVLDVKFAELIIEKFSGRGSAVVGYYLTKNPQNLDRFSQLNSFIADQMLRDTECDRQIVSLLMEHPEKFGIVLDVDYARYLIEQFGLEGIKIVVDNYDKFNIVSDSKSIYQLIEKMNLDSADFFVSNSKKFRYDIIFFKSIDFLETITKNPRIKQDVKYRIVAYFLDRKAVLDFPKERREFWKLFIDNSQDFSRWFFYKRCNAGSLYEKIDIKKEQKEYVNEILLTPEKIRRWESLRVVFDQIKKIQDGNLRAEFYLRIAEAISVITLTGRTEVEALAGMQASFCGLYRENMTDFEKRSWNLLKKQLPFATNENIRRDMRNQALPVEAVNARLFSWVHQAIHNFVRAQTPEYMEALKDYIVNRDEESKNKLQTIAGFYTDESKPASEFFAEKNSQILKEALPELEKLIKLSSDYYRINPSQITQLSGLIKNSLERIKNQDDEFSQIKNKVLKNIEYLQKSFEQEINQNNQKEKESNSEHFPKIDFLKNIGQIRMPLLRLSEKINLEKDKNPNMSQELVNLNSHVLSFDAVVTHFHKVLLAEYSNKYLEKKLKDNDLTKNDAIDFIKVLKNILASGRLEGEINSFKQSEEIMAGDIFEKAELGDAFSVHVLALSMAKENWELNNDWKSFNEMARLELVAMLKRLGKTENEAEERVIMNDLVRFEKASYKFSLEPMLKLFLDNFEKIKKAISENDLIEPDELYEKYAESEVDAESAEQNPVMRRYLQELFKGRMSDSLNEASNFLGKLESLPEVKVNTLCRYLPIEGFINQESGQRQYTKVEKNGKTIELFPFTHYGVTGVAVMVDGKIENNPYQTIKKLFSQDMFCALEKYVETRGD